MRTWIKPMLAGMAGTIIGAVLAFTCWQGWVTYQRINAIWIWANAAEGRLQKLESVNVQLMPPILNPPKADKK